MTAPHIPYIRCTETTANIRTLPNSVIQLRNFSILCNGFENVTVFERPWSNVPFLREIMKWERDFKSHPQMRIARGSAFASWHNVEMFAVSPAKRSLLYSILL